MFSKFIDRKIYDYRERKFYLRMCGVPLNRIFVRQQTKIILVLYFLFVVV